MRPGKPTDAEGYVYSRGDRRMCRKISTYYITDLSVMRKVTTYSYLMLDPFTNNSRKAFLRGAKTNHFVIKMKDRVRPQFLGHCHPYYLLD
jgi:hypothetical protein